MSATATAVERPKLSPTQHAIASQCAGAISTTICYPVEVVKMRFMSQDGTIQRQHNGQTYRSTFASMATIRREEGLQALFRGCHVSVTGTVMAWGVYMYAYRYLCNYAESLYAHSSKTPSEAAATKLPFVYCCILSIFASSASAVVCNPIWLLKTRMQLEEASARTAGQPRYYSGFIVGCRHVLRASGVRALWTGVSAQVALGVPNAFNLPLYDAIKAARLWQTQRPNLNAGEVLLCSTLTKVMLAIICHPLTMLKTRLQDHRSRLGEVKYESLPQATLTVWRRNGVVGMYRGLVPSLMQTVPRSALMYLCYEQMMKVVAAVPV